MQRRLPAFNWLDNFFDSHGSLDDIAIQANVQQRRMAMMNEIEEHERKIVNEFCHLLEKSRLLFNGLRDLPQYGYKQWPVYFTKTFDLYTRLWKFQQQHRPVLDAKYDLKRWQIGEIASKIGQLYYHYYLRTSETNYLYEAFSFYSAIRARGYYSRANKEERSDLMVKKLRYYARFIVVCLLLKKMKLVRDLVRELAKQIDDYANIYDPEDQVEWSLILTEIKAFIDADNLTTVIDVDNLPVIISHRLNPLNTPPPLEKIPSIRFMLNEVLIVGNISDQIKFCELTLDMFRMLQAFEREPQEEPRSISNNRLFVRNPSGPSNHSSSHLLNCPGDPNRLVERDNPHKFLLYRPTVSQLLVFLTCSFKELPANGVLLVYISADGVFGCANSQQYMTPGIPPPPGIIPGQMAPNNPPYYAMQTISGLPPGYEHGGLACNNHHADDTMLTRSNLGPVEVQSLIDPHCLYPGDMFIFLRKPLFLIVDSDNSQAFTQLPRLFGQPLLVLMSPEESPAPFQQQQQQHGSLFTLFLHCPLTALCLISNIIEMPLQIWDKAQIGIDRFLLEAGRLLMRSRQADPVFIHFYADDFLRLIILRFVFCCVLMRMHRLFRGRSFAPCSHPPLPDPEIIEHPTLRRAVQEIAITLDIRSHFAEIDEHE